MEATGPEEAFVEIAGWLEARGYSPVHAMVSPYLGGRLAEFTHQRLRIRLTLDKGHLGVDVAGNDDDWRDIDIWLAWLDHRPASLEAKTPRQTLQLLSSRLGDLEHSLRTGGSRWTRFRRRRRLAALARARSKAFFPGVLSLMTR